MESFEEPLLSFGLSSREAKIYISLVETGPSSVAALSRHSGVNRSTVYVVLRALEKKGLAKITDDRKIRMFMATSPDVLLIKTREITEKQLKIRSEIEYLVPKLRAAYKDTFSKPTIRIYEGKEGLWETYFDVFSSDVKEFRVYEDLSNILKVFPDFIQHDSIQRLTRGIDLYSIAPARKEIIDLCLSGVTINHEELVFIPQENFKSPVDITIYGDKVAFASSRDLFGIIIEHAEIAEALKSSFDLAIAEAKRLNDKQGIKLKEPSYNFRTPTDKSKLPELVEMVKESLKHPEEFLKKYGT